MRIITTDPISGNEVKDLENAPYIIDRSGHKHIKIYFDSEQNLNEYVSHVVNSSPKRIVKSTFQLSDGRNYNLH